MDGIKNFLISIIGQGAFNVLWMISKAIIITIVGLIIIKIVLKAVDRWLSKGKIDETAHPFIRNSIKILCIVFLIMTVLPVINIPVTSFIATIGAAGVAVALALQSSLSNLAGGIIILFTKPFSKGDYIDDLTVQGNVEEINMLYTTLLTLDNKTITIPNGQLSNGKIINYTKQELRRLDLVFSISYDDDITKAKNVLKRIIKDNPLCLSSPGTIIGVKAHNSSSVDIDVKVWVKNADYFNVSYALKEQVKNAFDKENINIPYPKMDICIKNEGKEKHE